MQCTQAESCNLQINKYYCVLHCRVALIIMKFCCLASKKSKINLSSKDLVIYIAP